MSSNKSTDRQEFEEQLAAQLRRTEQQLQNSPQQRLQTMRETAIKHACFSLQHPDSSRRPNGSFQDLLGKKWSGLLSNWQWEPVLLVAGLVLIGVMLALPGQSPGVMNPDNNMAIEEGAHEDPEFYESLEFYEWLAEQEQAG